MASTSVLPLNEAVSGLRPRDLREVFEWPHQGPRVALEYTQAVSTLGLHEFLVRQSGIHAESSVSWEHKLLCSMLALWTSYDRLDTRPHSSWRRAASS